MKMIIPKLALRSLVRNKKSSLILIGLVTVGVVVFLVGDAVLGVAASGIRGEFRNGYTGDVAVRARFERKFGVFGFSVPTIGEYEEMPTLGQSGTIRSMMESMPEVASMAGLVSGAALLEGPRGRQFKVPVFGVDAESYFNLFPSLRFLAGKVPKDTEAWIILPKARSDEISKAEKRVLSIGDELQLTMASGSAFTIRAVRLAGIIDTPMRGNSEYAAVYTDPYTLRALLGLGMGASGLVDGSAPASPGFDPADFFSDAAPLEAQASQDGASGLELVSHYLETAADPRPRETLDPDAGDWHFFLARVAEGANPASTARRLNAAFGDAGIQAEAVEWLAVAGLNASILYLLKTVFEIGIAILAAVIVLVLTNGLAFSVMEQTREIGTMRAIGARKAFVSVLFLLQSVFLVLSGTVLGIGIAWLALSTLGVRGVPITNSYLLLLFGSPLLKPMLLSGAIWIAFGGGFVVAAVASIYPVGLAMRTSEAQSMAVE